MRHNDSSVSRNSEHSTQSFKEKRKLISIYPLSTSLDFVNIFLEIEELSPKDSDEKSRLKFMSIVGKVFGRKRCKGILEEIDPQSLISKFEIYVGLDSIQIES